MVTDFHLVLALAGFGMFAAAPTIIVPLLFAPRKPGPVKNALYESGQLDLAKKEILRIRYRATPEIAKVAIILATAYIV